VGIEGREAAEGTGVEGMREGKGGEATAEGEKRSEEGGLRL
jgi:hypothetical protein